MNVRRRWWFLLWIFALEACAIGVTTRAPRPDPNLIPRGYLDAKFQLVMTDPRLGVVCARGFEDGIGRFCIEGLGERMREGLTDVLALYIQPTSATDPLSFKAVFRLIEIAMSAAPGGQTAQLTVRYQFWLEGPDGRTFAELAETVVGPEAYATGADARHVVGALMNAVLEHVGAAVNRASMAMDAQDLDRERKEAERQRRNAELQAKMDAQDLERKRKEAERQRQNAELQAKIELERQRKAILEKYAKSNAEPLRQEQQRLEQERQRVMEANLARHRAAAQPCEEYIRKRKPPGRVFLQAHGPGGACWQGDDALAAECSTRCARLLQE